MSGDLGAATTETLTVTVLGDPAPQVEQLPPHMQRNILIDDNGCWLWTRSRSRDGYGWASLDNRTRQAHRLAYVLLIGEPPTGMVLDHLCRVRHCVNPAHLEPVTPRENLERSPIVPAGQASCLKCGGEFTERRGQRRCLPCERVHRAAYMRAQRAKARATR